MWGYCICLWMLCLWFNVESILEGPLREEEDEDLRVWSIMDIALFPFLGTVEHLLEFDSVGDVAEAEGDGAHLVDHK